MYARDLNESKYQFFIKKRADAGIKHYNNPNAFIDYSNMVDEVYENINDYNSIRKKNISLMTWLQILWQIENFEP